MASAKLDPGGEAPPFTLSSFDRVRSRAALRGAFRRVRETARRSTSASTREELARFEERAEHHLARIARDLGKGRFAFAPARGVAQERPGKIARPIVIAPIETRIVARAILDAVTAIPAVRAAFLESPASFGGVPGRGVPEAVAAAIEAARSGHVWTLRSDIAGFFRRIPRPEAIARLAPHVGDERLVRLIDEATRTEIDNLAELGDSAALFPEEETGVAQGSSLSTLLGNVLLRDFDAQLNGRGIVCVRYVDDFLLLGREAAHVRKAFQSAQRALGALGLYAYDPAVEPEKACFAHADGGFELLGCEIHGGRARPSRRKRDELFGRVDSLLSKSERFLSDPDPRDATRLGLAPTLGAVSRLLEGFRSGFAFCDDGEAFAALDRAVDGRLEKYLRVFRQSSATDPLRRAERRGVFSLIQNRAASVP
jgi:RNA-directed DNA polymerase